MNRDEHTSPFFEGTLFVLSLAVFSITPLFFIEIKQDDWVPGFIPILMVNAALKFSVFILITSFVIGIIWIRAHLNGKIINYPPSFLIFSGIFLFSVILSSINSHNFQRAWISSFQWHFLPLILVFSLFQFNWSRRRTSLFLSTILVGGIASCLLVMDQHYQWTDWSHRLPRLGYGALIYNQNFAAEYHAPLIPLAVGLFFYLRNRSFRFFLLLIIFFIFLPALSLSLARGAWVGMMGGCGISGLLFLIIYLKKVIASKQRNEGGIQLSTKDKKKKENNNYHAIGIISASFILLSLLLPLYLYTSDYWKKGAFTSGTQKAHDSFSREADELKSIIPTNGKGGSNRRLELWQDTLASLTSNDFIWGKGTDHYELHFHESAEISDRTTGSSLVRFVHNDFLQLLYENGIFGLIGFLGLWIVLLWRAFIAVLVCFKSDDSANLGLMIGLIASCLTFLIECFFEFPSRSPCALLIGWSCYALLFPLSNQVNNKTNFRKHTINPPLKLILGAAGIFIIFYGAFLSRDLFWANIYHFQGRIAGDYGEKEKSLRFHQKSVEYAPWMHHSRKWEAFYLLTHKKQFPEALRAINETLEVHPGCLVAHQNKISVLRNEFKDEKKALKAYREMKKAAPFHPYTLSESRKFPNLKK